MERSIILNLNGDIHLYGFQVVVEVADAGGRESRSEGYLPPSPLLEDKYQQWQSSLQALTKIKNPKGEASKNVPLLNKIQYLRESRQEAKYYYKDAEKSLVATMNNWLRSESFMGIREILDSQISDSGTGRLIIRTSNLDLKKLPWESWEWLDRANRKVTVSYSSLNFVSPPHIIPKYLRIIAIIAQASNLNVQEDLNLLRQRLPANIILEPYTDVSRQELLEHLNKKNCDILYFAGHGKSEGDRAKVWINETEYLEIEDLKNALKNLRLNGLKLAIFNCCNGLGLANNLDEENLSIPNLIFMRDAIHDRVAQKFLQELIAGFISEKLPLHQAVQRARESLHELEEDFPGSSLQPILISGANQAQHYQDWLPKKDRQSQFFKLVINSLAITLIAGGLKAFGWLEDLEFKTYDLMLTFKSSEPLDPRLLIVDVDVADLNYLQGEYPIEDKTLLQSLQNLNKHQPKAIGIDIYRYPPLNKDIQAAKEYQELIKYWQNNRNIVFICDHINLDRSVNSQTPQLDNIGFIDVPLDEDEVIRRSLLVVEPPVNSSCQAEYSLSAYLALNYLQSKGYSIDFSKNNVLQITNPKNQKVFSWEPLQPYVSFYSNPKTTSAYQILLNYRHTDSVTEISQRVSFRDVLAGKVSAAQIRDRIILIGISDPNIAKDEFKTPYNSEIRGLWLHAHMVSQLISSVEDDRPLFKFIDWELQILLVWLLSLGTCWVTWRFKYLTSLKIAGVIVVLLYTISLGALLTQGLIIPIIPAILALLIALLTGLISTVISLQQEYAPGGVL